MTAEVDASLRNHFCLGEIKPQQGSMPQMARTALGLSRRGRSLCAASERLRKGRFLSSAGFGFFLLARRWRVKIKQTQKGDKVHAASLPGTLLRSTRRFPTPGSFSGPLTKSCRRLCHNYRNRAVFTSYHLQPTLLSDTADTGHNAGFPTPQQRGT